MGDGFVRTKNGAHMGCGQCGPSDFDGQPKRLRLRLAGLNMTETVPKRETKDPWQDNRGTRARPRYSVGREKQ